MSTNILDRNSLILREGTIYRILEVQTSSCLCIDCIKRTMPKWIPKDKLTDGVLCSEEELHRKTKMDFPIMESLSQKQQQTIRERYTIISGVLPHIAEERMRTQALKNAARYYDLNKRTIINYLCTYLAYQDITALAPKVSPKPKPLTQDQKNIRWALNKFYYTRKQNALTDAYVMMLKERYTDNSGNLIQEHPSFHQFRYFYRQTKSLQKEYISREGIKNYEMNFRPLLGEGVQQFAPTVGTGMLDATICDIYLCDDSGALIGRPVLVICVDAFSKMICGYSLLWESGMYSVRELLLNCVTDKVEWCRRFGIIISPEEWDCSELPGILVTDMGTEFTSYNLEQITELGCRLINLPAFRAELKGPVEQAFCILQDLYKPYLKGKGVVDVDFRKRGGHDYRKDARLTLRQFEQIILRCIIYYNTKRILERFPYTEDMLHSKVPPHASDIWNYGKAQRGANLIPVSEQRLVLTLLPRSPARFTRMGLRVNGLRYAADGYTEEYLKGGDAVAAYSPDDISHAWLLQQGEYIRFDLIDSCFQGKSLDCVKNIKSERRDLIKEWSQDALQGRVELAQHIEAISSHLKPDEDVKIQDLRKTRRTQKYRMHQDLSRKLIERLDSAQEGRKL